MKAVQEREYTNYFKMYGYDEKEIADKLDAIYETFSIDQKNAFIMNLAKIWDMS